MSMVIFRVMCLLSFLSSELIASRVDLLWELINEKRAPTVASLIDGLGFSHLEPYQSLARETIIMLYNNIHTYQDGEATEDLFRAARLVNNEAHINIVMDFINEIIDGDDESDSDSHSISDLLLMIEGE